jgi:hypothetical protein
LLSAIERLLTDVRERLSEGWGGSYEGAADRKVFGAFDLRVRLEVNVGTVVAVRVVMTVVMGRSGMGTNGKDTSSKSSSSEGSGSGSDSDTR